MTNQPDADFFRYQRLFGVTGEGLQIKVTIITDNAARIRSASMQLRAVDGDIATTSHPALWSKPFPLKPNTIGEDEFGGAA